MPTDSYQNREIATDWEPNKGWYYRVDSSKWYGPFESEEEAIEAAEYRIDLEDWE
ncbi:MAG TPA: hypothetical protein VE944_29050 [Nostoc sp.]|uniref:hypothetical protein n=1 Tax=Nostoc sp. TaxID=1180 RepID=UPI002D49DAB8|nr:hypothetical protein [Nostoc sp.]HYX18343.1 hypothetical protein [Nostoc sp.]